MTKGEEPRFVIQRRLRDFSQRGVIIQHIKATAEGRQHDVVLALLNRDIAHLRHGESALELRPLLTAVDGDEQSELRAGEDEILVDVIRRQRRVGVEIGRASCRERVSFLV